MTNIYKILKLLDYMYHYFLCTSNLFTISFFPKDAYADVNKYKVQ